jgi:hypothetical protein
MKTKNLTKKLLVLALLAGTIITGCSKNDGIMNPNGNAQVSFQISQQQGQNGGVEFLFVPSADVKLSQIVVKLPEQQFEETLTANDPNAVLTKGTLYIINEYINVSVGQKWSFEFTGNAATGTNTNYKVTSNYTVK